MVPIYRAANGLFCPMKKFHFSTTLLKFKMTILVQRPKFLAIFFLVIFALHNVRYNLLEFESEKAKNRRMGARGFNCKIFVDSEVKFEFYD